MFNDPHVKAELEFMLRTVFHHVPAGVRETGDFAGESYDQYWWRSCALEEGEQPGTQGYLVVWYDHDNQFNTFHTYRYPPDLY